MTERSILFSAPMIHALLEGRKSQTRRLAWRERKCEGGPINDGGGQMDYVEPSIVRSPSPWQAVKPGDRVWVRENWCPRAEDGRVIPGAAHYMADGEHVVKTDGDGFTVKLGDGREASPWRPSIHMPRWASRMTLVLTDVRVQRLQDISEADAEAEGLWRSRARRHLWWLSPNAVRIFEPYRSHLEAFSALWNSLHGPGSWEKNPEVVALSFTVERKAP